MYKIKWEIEVDDYELDNMGYANNKLGACQYVWNKFFNTEKDNDCSIFKVDGKYIDVKKDNGKVEDK
jgi:hypothetical protein